MCVLFQYYNQTSNKLHRTVKDNCFTMYSQNKSTMYYVSPYQQDVNSYYWHNFYDMLYGKPEERERTGRRDTDASDITQVSVSIYLYIIIPLY